MNFHCERCYRTGRYPSWVTARWLSNTVHRCEHCGTAYCVRHGTSPTVIHPELLGIHEHGKLSPWFDPRHRPYRKNVYECEFRDGLRLRLTWNGRAWTWCGLIVDMQDQLKWRGVWPA